MELHQSHRWSAAPGPPAIAIRHPIARRGAVDQGGPARPPVARTCQRYNLRPASVLPSKAYAPDRAPTEKLGLVAPGDQIDRTMSGSKVMFGIGLAASSSAAYRTAGRALSMDDPGRLAVAAFAGQMERAILAGEGNAEVDQTPASPLPVRTTCSTTSRSSSMGRSRHPGRSSI